jgi:hypothetical protein
MVNVYSYIAQSNPYSAKQTIESFGYRIVDRNNMGKNLQQLVINEGEEALRAVMDNHPDKDIIIEMFANDAQPEKKPCGCKGTKDTYANASGTETAPAISAKTVEKDFSVLFLAGIIILALSIQNLKS